MHISRPRAHLSTYLLLFGLLAVWVKKANAEEGHGLTDVPTLATPLTIVPPAFPAKSQAPDGGIRVDIVGRVLPDGQMEPKSISSPTGFEAYAESVSGVLKWWRFVPAVDSETCAAREQDYSMAVWFEGSTESPRVDIAYPKGKATDATRTSVPAYESISDPYIDFPPRLSRTEGQVRVLMLVEASGDVSQVNVLSSTPYGVFNSTVLAAAKATKVKWKSPSPGKPICAQRSYVFCTWASDRTRVKFSGCK